MTSTIRSGPLASVALLLATAGLTLTIAGTAHAQAQGGGEPPTLSVAQWEEDLAAFSLGMRETHLNLFHTITEAQFDSAVATLQRHLPDLERHEIIVELARIVAMVGDGHTTLWLTPNAANGFRQLPILLYWLQDGLYVLAIAEEEAAAVGGRVVRIGEVDVDEALARVRPLVPRDNEMGVLSITPRYLAIPEVLEALEITDSIDRATYTVETRDGGSIEVELEAIPDAWLANLGVHPVIRPGEGDRIEMAVAGPSENLPLWLRDPANLFWYVYLEDSRTLYVQLNAIQHKSDDRMDRFFERVFAAADTLPFDRFVLDLRFNGGGNNFNNYPLLRAIVKRDSIDQNGRFFVITSRHTFSAAGHLVTYLERQTDALFVGEPTGASPNHYGDAGDVILPNSGLRAFASTIYWQNSLPYPFETRPWTPPDIAAELTIEDWRSGRDPAMEAILAYVPEPPLVEQMMSALESVGVDAMLAAYRAYKDAPNHEFTNTEAEINRFGYDLLRDSQVDAAVAVFRLNVQDYPESANVYDSYGDGLRAAGDREGAIAAYRKALEIDPGFAASQRNLAELLGGS